MLVYVYLHNNTSCCLYRVHPCLASRDIMTCQKTNTLYHHHHHHGACPSKTTAAVVFPFLPLSSSLIHVHFFPTLRHLFPPPFSLSFLFKPYLLPQYSFGLYPLLTFTSFPLFSHIPLATLLFVCPTVIPIFLSWKQQKILAVSFLLMS